MPGPHTAHARGACACGACDRRYIRRTRLNAADALSHDRLRPLLRRRVHGELAAQPLRALVEALHDRVELRVLRLGRLELLPAAARDDPRRLRGWGLGLGHPLRAVPSRRHGRRGRGPARDPRLVQVLRLRLGERRQRQPRRRAGPGDPVAAGRAAHRDLVLHLHGHQLRRRHLPARARARQATRLRALPLLLPAPPGRPDRAGVRAAAPDPPPARPAHGGLLAGLLADPGRPVQEGRHLLVRGECDRGAGLHLPLAALRARGDLRGVGVCGPDLLRLQRLHRHRHRPRPPARLPVPPELRRAVHVAEPAGLLATLAHDAVALAA